MKKFALQFILLAALLSVSDVSAVELGREEIATGFTSPVFMTAPPGDTSRLFVVEQRGVIKIITLSNNAVLGTAFLSITTPVDSGQNEQGLLGMAFHPDYDTNGFFYLYYSHDPAQGSDVSRVVRYTANPPFATSNTADAGSEVILLSFAQPQSNHNGGMLAFEPRGDGKAYLYIASGDGGGTGDNDAGHDSQLGNGQALDTLLGKLLRIDVDEGGDDAGTGGANYDIPASNPDLGVGSLPEIWAFGLRNPYRFSFDRDTGDLYIGDVGQGDWEEIDFQPAASPGGENYGWRLTEGPDCFTPSNNCDPGGITVGPVFSYPHPSGFAVIGGYVYRGTAIPFMEGHYLFADIAGLTKSILVSGGTATMEQDWDAELLTNNISSFGEDANGENYFAIRPSINSSSATVFKIVPTDNDVVWVDFDSNPAAIKKGSQSEPFDNLDIAVRSVIDDGSGQLNIKGDSLVTTTSETITFDRAMTITANNGAVRIGVGARSSRSSTEGFVAGPNRRRQ